MNIPLLDLKAQHDPIHDEILTAISEKIRAQNFILGKEVERLEQQVSSYCGCEFGIGVSSGTDALLVSLMALGIGLDDEVITTDFSFFATAGVISRVGAKPVFVDIDPETYNIDPAKIENAITPKTKAIIPVHLYGQCAEMAPIMALAEKYDLAVVEDAAQAIGAEDRDGRRAGGLGALGCLSFFPTKNLGAFGDGGMVVTNDSSLAEKVRCLRVHGSSPKYYHKIIGGNFRLDTLQAAVLNVKLNYLDDWTRQRQKNAEQYARIFKDSGLEKDQEIYLPAAVYKDKGTPHYHIYNQFVIRVPDRDRLREYLKSNGISTEIYYPLPFHLQECFHPLSYREGDFPVAEKAAQETLALPIYPDLTEEMQKEVVRKIKEFYAR